MNRKEFTAFPMKIYRDFSCWVWSILMISILGVQAATPQPAQISGLRSVYSAPYLLDFNFSLRDQAGHPIITNVSAFKATCLENGQPISQSESGFRLLPGDNKQLKCYLVLDYTSSMINPALNGDANGDGRSDSVEAMEAGAKQLIGTLRADSQIGIYEFHRADAGFPPAKVADLTVDKSDLTNEVNQIYNQVVWTSGSTRCWDALYLAIGEFPASNPLDAQRFVVVLSDGSDNSSTYTPDKVISLAQQRQVKVYCVGYGDELTPANLQKITAQTGGQYFLAANVNGLSAAFQQIVMELGGQYVLRWATLKRGNDTFTPSFQITNLDYQASATASSYTPSNYDGNELAGRLSFDSSLSRSNVATLVLRASYIPRGITRIRLSYLTAYPAVVAPIPYDQGGICPTNWSFALSQAQGATTAELSSPNPGNPFSALPVATLGKLMSIQLSGVTNLSQCFYDVALDNSVYQGGYSLNLDNAGNFVPPPGPPPQGTPVEWLQGLGYTSGYALAELMDLDGDGMPNWMEYVAGTDPTNKASVFRLLSLARNGEQITLTLNTASNRIYLVERSPDLVNWSQVGDAFVGDGNVKTLTDNAVASLQFYRAKITGITNPYAFLPNILVSIKPGTFTMSSPGTEVDRYSNNEGPQTVVTLTKAFWMGKYEVTQAEYLALMGSNPSEILGDLKRPVEHVYWNDAMNYCTKLTSQERAAGRLPAGYVYRLPTEAEWEYACRAGTTTRFSFGDDPNYTQLGNYAWFSSNSGGTTHPVGMKLPNPWGLYDMHGNVWEWCLDWIGVYPGGSMTDPRGPNTGSSRADRGGGWADDGRYCRSACRGGFLPDVATYLVGFRPVLAPGP